MATSKKMYTIDTKTGLFVARVEEADFWAAHTFDPNRGQVKEDTKRKEVPLESK